MTYKIFLIGLLTLQMWTGIAGKKANTVLVNVLDPQYYGMENGGTGWYFYNQTFWSVTSEKAGSGTYCLKYTNAATAAATYKALIGSASNLGSLINIKAGTYTMKIKVYIDPAAEITGVATVFRPAFQNVSWSFASVAKGEWVELSQQVTFAADLVDGSMLVQMATTYGGKGTLYVDDITIMDAGTVARAPLPLVSEIKTVDTARISLSADTYDISLKVFVASGSTINSFYTALAEPCTVVKWDLSQVARDAWVTLTAKFQLDIAADSSVFMIQIPNNPEFGGGTGLLYVDDVHIQNAVVDRVVAVNSAPRVLIYPNPASGFCTIETDVPCHIQIISPAGAVCKSENSTGGKFLVSVKDLAHGIYMVKLNSAGLSTISKLQIK